MFPRAGVAQVSAEELAEVKEVKELVGGRSHLGRPKEITVVEQSKRQNSPPPTLSLPKLRALRCLFLVIRVTTCVRKFDGEY